MHYAENECAMPIRLHCNELRALCLTTNALCRTAEIGALLLKCVLIVYIWPEKGVDNKFQQHQHQHGNPVPVSIADSGPHKLWEFIIHKHNIPTCTYYYPSIVIIIQTDHPPLSSPTHATFCTGPGWALGSDGRLTRPRGTDTWPGPAVGRRRPAGSGEVSRGLPVLGNAPVFVFCEWTRWDGRIIIQTTNCKLP